MEPHDSSQAEEHVTDETPPTTAGEEGSPDNSLSASTPSSSPTIASGAVISPSVGSSDGSLSTTPSGTSVPSGPKKRWPVPLACALVVLVILGGGYVFGIYLPSRPSSAYETSLKKSGEALDALVSYSNTVAAKNYHSYDLKGSVHSTGTASFDATLNGAIDMNGDSTFKLGADVLGSNVGINVESVHVNGSVTPDLYVQVSGIKQELNSFGLNNLDYLDGQWVSIDHTLINSYVADLNKGVSSVTGSSAVPTAQQVSDAMSRVQTVNKQYIFTTDTSKAVLVHETFLGHDTKDGRDMYHYRVGYSKLHLQNYLDALAAALDSSSLNAWSKAANNGKNVSQLLGISGLKTSVGKANAQYRFELWVDAKTKLLHAVQFVDPADKNSILTVAQNYTGGNVYPFSVTFNGTDPSGGGSEKATLSVALNTSSDVATSSASISEGTATNLSSTFTLTPSKDDVQVIAPVSAKPLMTILSGLGLHDSGL